eukprot:scaffold42212_cov64-Phaeocystis_antarctica.AAC.5
MVVTGWRRGRAAVASCVERRAGVSPLRLHAPLRPLLHEDGTLAGLVHAQLVVEVEHVKVGLGHLLLAEEREDARDEGARHGQRQREPPPEEREEKELGEAHLSEIVSR